MYAKSPEQATRWLQHSYEKAQRFVETNISSDKALILNLGQQALSMPWTGRTGLTDRATYLAHLHIAGKIGKAVYGASVRELAEYAGLAKDTVSHANQRLVQKGLLRREKAHTLKLSATWQLDSTIWEGSQDASLGHSLTVGKCRECPKLAISHDAFRWRRGKAIGQAWQVLLASDLPLSCEQLANQTGRGKRTIRRALNWMKQHGLAEQVEDAWVGVATANLDEIAQKIGTAGKATKQKLRHALERRQHNQRLLANEAPKHGN